MSGEWEDSGGASRGLGEGGDDLEGQAVTELGAQMGNHDLRNVPRPAFHKQHARGRRYEAAEKIAHEITECSARLTTPFGRGSASFRLFQSPRPAPRAARCQEKPQGSPKTRAPPPGAW